jgi:hypothetical protein
MYNPHNFWDISGAMIYQKNVADADFCYKEIEPPPVDANTSDFSEITSDNTPDNFDTVCHTLRHKPNCFSEYLQSRTAS